MPMNFFYEKIKKDEYVSMLAHMFILGFLTFWGADGSGKCD